MTAVQSTPPLTLPKIPLAPRKGSAVLLQRDVIGMWPNCTTRNAVRLMIRAGQFRLESMPPISGTVRRLLIMSPELLRCDSDSHTILAAKWNWYGTAARCDRRNQTPCSNPCESSPSPASLAHLHVGIAAAASSIAHHPPA